MAGKFPRVGRILALTHGGRRREGKILVDVTAVEILRWLGLNMNGRDSPGT